MKECIDSEEGVFAPTHAIKSADTLYMGLWRETTQKQWQKGQARFGAHLHWTEASYGSASITDRSLEGAAASCSAPQSCGSHREQRALGLEWLHCFSKLLPVLLQLWWAERPEHNPEGAGGWKEEGETIWVQFQVLFHEGKDAWGSQKQSPEAMIRLWLGNCWGISPRWCCFCILLWVVKSGIGSCPATTISCAWNNTDGLHISSQGVATPVHSSFSTHACICIYTHIRIQYTYFYSITIYTVCVCVCLHL